MSKKPHWAKWWAVHANGVALWFEHEPIADFSSLVWGYCKGRAKFDQHFPPPETFELTLKKLA